jgi:hypothetical protein
MQPIVHISLDLTDIDEALDTAALALRAGVDWLEAGTPLILAEGTLEDLRREEGGAVGYAKRLRHGEIGKGLNDYDAIFTELAGKGFRGWISIEDGVEGMDQLARSVAFLKRKIAEHWPD